MRSAGFPELQSKYGLGAGGVTPACVPGAAPNCFVGFGSAGSWGPEIPAGAPRFNHADEMFQSGHTFDNALTISGGNDRTTFFLSGGATAQQGTISRQQRQVRPDLGPLQWIPPGLRQSQGRRQYRVRRRHRRVHHQPQQHRWICCWVPGGRRRTSTISVYLDPTTGLHRSYRFPNPAAGSEQASRFYDNPFFVANESFNRSEVGRTFGGINADFAATSWLSFAYTLGADYSNDERTQAWPWSTSNTTVVGVNGVGGVNAGYVRSFQIDHNLTATARYRVSPAFSGAVTVGQNLNSNTYQTRQTLGTGLIAPEPLQSRQYSGPAPALRLQADHPAGVVLRAGQCGPLGPALSDRRAPERRCVDLRRR